MTDMSTQAFNCEDASGLFKQGMLADLVAKASNVYYFVHVPFSVGGVVWSALVCLLVCLLLVGIDSLPNTFCGASS
jgi:hypothetical protein